MGGTVQRKQERNDVQRKGKGVGVWCNSATLVERTFLYYSLCVVCTHLCHVCMYELATDSLESLNTIMSCCSRCSRC